VAAEQERDMGTDYDVHIKNGTIVDGTKVPRFRGDLWIKDGVIAQIGGRAKGVADQVVDAAGCIVAPGFIDLHTHSPTPLGQYYQLMDGVTTALELEAGAFPVREYGSQISDAPLTHYGASVGYLSGRLLVKDGIALPDTTGSPWPVGLKGWWTAIRLVYEDLVQALERTFTEAATPEERKALRAILHEGLDQGGLGIGLALDYISEAVDEQELAMVFEVAGERQAPVFVHVRRGINGDPAGLREVLRLAEKTHAPLHVCHISHNGMKTRSSSSPRSEQPAHAGSTSRRRSYPTTRVRRRYRPPSLDATGRPSSTSPTRTSSGRRPASASTKPSGRSTDAPIPAAR
jgi:hypothetical protein